MCCAFALHDIVNLMSASYCRTESAFVLFEVEAPIFFQGSKLSLKPELYTHFQKVELQFAEVQDFEIRVVKN